MKPSHATNSTNRPAYATGEPFRVFVSYYEKDQKFAKEIIQTLGKGRNGLGFDVKGMHDLQINEPFADRIREWIAHSHFMIPVITKNSLNRPWVNQEIGYAMARNIPVFPVVSGIPPGSIGMLQALQALLIDDPGELRCRLRKIKWAKEVRNVGQQSFPVFSCDPRADERTRMLADAAHTVGKDFQKARIRQRSRLTSFSIPRVLGEVPWNGLPHHRLQELQFWLHTPERQNFETLVQKAGCDLIIDPDYYQADYDPAVQCARLKTLRDFLHWKKDHLVRVVVQEGQASDSMTIIGNHWAMFSASVATAFYTERDSISTWHAPTVESHCAIFDENFEKLLENQNREVTAQSPREYAIKRIDAALAANERRLLRSRRKSVGNP